LLDYLDGVLGYIKWLHILTCFANRLDLDWEVGPICDWIVVD